MALESGTRLGHYEITDQLGKGGMGEVYRARDTKLGREVAIKVLPSEFAQDAERLARLEREARMLAALNHPNIAAIYGLEQSEDTRFLVLELVEGDSLADRLKRGAIPMEESLRLALQIAEALEAAHEKGVIHRDLKPANIKITPEGRVKVLDFGLAKAFEGSAGDVNLSNSPTLSMAATQAGIILGTAAYMSPEQAKGQETDRQTDIWAFGCVLFEMLAGRPAFDAVDLPETLAAVIRGEPGWSHLRTDPSSRLRSVLDGCIRKERSRRYHDIADVRIELEFVQDNPEVGPGTVTAPVRMSRRALIGWGLGTAGVAGITGVAAWTGRPNMSGGIVRFEHTLAGDPTLTSNLGSQTRVVDVSSDGRHIVYSANDGLRLRAIDSLDEELIPGTEDVIGSPTFSPDDQWLVYQAGQLNAREWKRIAVSGGPPSSLGFDDGLMCSWDEQGALLLASPGTVRRFRFDTQELEDVVAGDASAGAQWLDNGAVLFGGDDGVFFLRPGAAAAVPVIPRPVEYVRYVPSTGHLIFVEGGVLYAAAFDPASLDVGQERALRNGVAPRQVTLSDTGSLIVMPAGGVRISRNNIPDIGRLSWVNRDGNTEILRFEAARYSRPRVSPDGTRLAVQITEEDGATDIWVGDIEGNSQLLRLRGGGNNAWPVWADGGQRLIFASDRDGAQSIYWQGADLRGAARPLTTPEDGIRHEPNSWSAQGLLSFTKAPSPRSIWTVGVDRDFVAGEPRLFVGGTEGADAQGSAFSPRGEWIVYRMATGDRGSLEDLFIGPFPPTQAEPLQITTEGGSNPIWWGDEIFYRRGLSVLLVNERSTPRLFSVEVRLDPRPFVGTEEALPVEGFVLAGGGEYDVHPDGDRFLTIFPEAANEAFRIEVVLNWIEELKERVPVG